MSVNIDIVYDGKLFCTLKHGPSGAVIETEAPRDNGGQGTKFSPTDLVGAALGSCILTIMGLAAQRQNLDLAGTQVHVEKEMATQPVRRIGGLKTVVRVPAQKAAGISAEDRRRIEAAARQCPVHRSLHPEIHAPIEFVWQA